MLATGISAEAVQLSRQALRMAGHNRFVCAFCWQETDDATRPCPHSGAPWPTIEDTAPRMGTSAADRRN